MKITERREGDVAVLVLEGRLDQGTADSVHAAAMALVGQGVKYLVVDLSGVSYIASVGIRALARPAQGIALNGGRFAVSSLQGPLKEFFSSRFTGVSDAFALYDTTAEAVRDIQAP